MIDEPPAVVRLNGLLAAARIAHEAIYDLHTELVASGRVRERVGELLAESVGITLRQIPDLTAEALRLARSWRQQSVLDPNAAGSTLRDLGVELERIEPDIRRELARQREIARELQSGGEEPT